MFALVISHTCDLHQVSSFIHMHVINVSSLFNVLFCKVHFVLFHIWFINNSDQFVRVQNDSVKTTSCAFITVLKQFIVTILRFE
jgi:hypothetical protein